MQIFLDSANINEINEIYELGIISGVTTNPSLIAKTSSDFYFTIAEICKVIPSGDVSIEVSANESKEMIVQGDKILDIASNIVIKLPLNWEGIKACKYFSTKGIKVNMTLCFSANQALIAAIAGATYISPFIGRLDDIGQDGVQLIDDIKLMYDNYDKTINTKILAASIRNINHFYKVAMIGADVVTMPGKIIKQLLDHPLTAHGLEIFDKDWDNSKLSM